jgi:hypothetical protein
MRPLKLLNHNVTHSLQKNSMLNLLSFPLSRIRSNHGSAPIALTALGFFLNHIPHQPKRNLPQDPQATLEETKSHNGSQK